MTRPDAGRLGTLAVLGLLATVFGARHLGPPRRETLALIGADVDLSVVWARLTVANTGLLDGQLTTALVLLTPRSSPLEHRAVQGPARMTPDGVAAGTDALGRTADGIELRIGGEGLAARIHARGATLACPPEPGEMAGMIEDKTDGRLMEGTAIVVRTRAGAREEGRALYVVGPAFAAVIDPSSDCPAWARSGSAAWSGAAPAFDDAVRLGEWSLTIRHLGTPVLQDGYAHLLPPERWLAAALGAPEPVVRVQRAIVKVEGPGVRGSRAGLLVTRGLPG